MFVGGCVRKHISKSKIDDIDIATIFTPEELKEIHILLYLDPANRDNYESDCEDDVDQLVLEQNDWTMDDTIYTITNGCLLEE